MLLKDLKVFFSYLFILNQMSLREVVPKRPRIADNPFLLRVDKLCTVPQ